METCGIVVEVNDTTVTIFTLEAGVQVRELIEDEPPKLAEFVLVLEDDYENRAQPIIPYFKLFEKDGVMHAQLLATTPNCFALPKVCRDKFEGAVWSPFLQYLNDPAGIFEGVRGGDVAECVVKYAPFEDKLFEVVSLVEWEKEPEDARLHIYRNTPWTLEAMAREMKPCHETMSDFYGCVNPYRIFSHDQVAIGVCIVHKAPNPLFDPNNTSSERFTTWLWSPTFGLIRWLFKPEEERPEVDMNHELEQHPNNVYEGAVGDRSNALGRWFSFKVNDVRLKQKKMNAQRGVADDTPNRRPSVFACAATRVVPADVEKPFKVVPKEEHLRKADFDRYELQMETSFPFKREDIQDDSSNEYRIKCDAHFYDHELGKVEIYPNQGKLILDKIDSHLDELRQKNVDEYEKKKDEIFIVMATVTVIDRYYSNARVYPKHGLFMLKEVQRIHYLHGGDNIYKKDE